MSNPTDSSASGTCCADKSNYTAAFLILRLFLGLRAFLSGLEKFESGGTYSFENYGKTMGRIASGITGASFLPSWATKAFALPLGYIFLALGIMLLLGIKTRLALILLALVWVGLGFGLMAVQSDEGAIWIGTYVGLTVGAMLLVRHNRFAIVPDRS